MSKKQLSLRELDFNNIGQWPQNAKIGLCAFIALVILLLAWLLFVRDKRTELEGLQGQETELRTDPGLRADRFVERWQKLHRASDQRYAAGDYAGHRAARAEMGNMAHSLERDPQMESLLAGRKRELGISFDSGRSLGRELAFHHGIDFGRGRGLGL